MNIRDLESFRLEDAVKFHDRLNPLIFTDEQMQQDVRDQLIKIAEDFVDFMGIDTLKVEDVRLYGSNAAYTYTPHSDLDLHILVDMTGISDDAVYLELFNSKKILYNDNLDITVRGLTVELYMQDSKAPVKSIGDYSVLNDRWVKFPVKSKASFELHNVIQKFKRLVVLAEMALRSNDLALLNEALSMIKRYRQAGLDMGGEFSPENLAYKALRSKGIVDKLYRHRDRLKSHELSIDEDYNAENPPGPEFKPTMPAGTVRVDVSDVYDWYKLGQNISNLERADTKTFGKGPPSTIMAFGSEDQEHEYIDALKKLGLDTTDIDPVDPSQPKNMPRQKVDPTYNVNESLENYNWQFAKSTMSGYQIEQGYWKVFQRRQDSGEQVKFEPYAFLGQYIEETRTNYLREHKSIDELKTFQKYLTTLDKRSSVSLRPGSSVSILQFIPLTSAGVIQVLGFKTPRKIKKVVRNVDGNINWIEFTDGGYFPDKEFYHNGIGGEWEGSSNLFFNSHDESGQALMLSILNEPIGWRISSSNLQENINEASGYIPSEREKDDPRWKTALTVDVHPETMRKGAIAMGLGKINRDGRPQKAKTSGKFSR